MIRVAALSTLLGLAGCPRSTPPTPQPTASPSLSPAAHEFDPRTCESLAQFQGSQREPNAWALATARAKYDDCTSGKCLTMLELHPYFDLRGPEIPVLEGGLPYAAAERLLERRDDDILLAAHVDGDASTLLWAYPLYYAAEGETMLSLLDAGRCPPVRLPRSAECTGCEPMPDLDTGCGHWEQEDCGIERTCARQFECHPSCCG